MHIVTTDNINYLCQWGWTYITNLLNQEWNVKWNEYYFTQLSLLGAFCTIEIIACQVCVRIVESKSTLFPQYSHSLVT